MTGPIDEVDRRILEAIVADGRASVQSIAEKVGLRRPSVHARLRRLEESGVVKGYHAALDPEALGSGMVGFVFLEVAHGNGKDCVTACGAIAEALRAMPGVLEVHTMAGDDDMLAKVRVGSLKDLQDLVLHRMSGLPNVKKVRTRVAMATHFERVLQAPKGRGKRA